LSGRSLPSRLVIHRPRLAARSPSVIARHFTTHQTIEHCQALSADPRDGCQLQVMRALQIIESEQAVVDQGAGSSRSQPVTFPRLGHQPVLFKDEASHVPIDKPPWSVNHKGSDRFKCPGCGKPWLGASTRWPCARLQRPGALPLGAEPCAAGGLTHFRPCPALRGSGMLLEHACTHSEQSVSACR
jgi:hypothetical protein